jgi:4-amino-4-deoxy-L-arabinose transferase-like glycosyltransferase
LFTWMYLMGLRRNSLILGLAAGLVFSISFNLRQLTALGFGCPFAIHLLWRWKQDKGKLLPFILSLVVGSLPILLSTLWYNRLMSGSFFRFPFHAYDPLERLGFGPMLDDLRYIHTPIKGIQNLLVSIGRYNLWFLGMPLSLVFIFPVFIWDLRNKGDRLCVGIILFFFLSYLFYYSPGVADTGPIYYFELLLPFALLTARGLLILYDKTRSWNRSFFWRPLFPLFFLSSLILGVISFWPEQALHLMAMTGKIREPYDLTERNVKRPAMVFIRSLPRVGWVFGFRSADPWLKAPILYCRDLGPEKNWEVVQHYPDRYYYILYFDGTKNENFIQPFSKEDLQKCLQSNP